MTILECWRCSASDRVTVMDGQALCPKHRDAALINQTQPVEEPKPKTVEIPKTIDDVYRAIMVATRQLQTMTMLSWDQLGWVIYLPTEWARYMDERASKRGDYSPVSQIKHGDTGNLFGQPFIVDDDIVDVFIGQRIVVKQATR